MAGLAAELDQEDDYAMHLFLRACEPPAHNRWTHDTKRQNNTYERGAKTELERWMKAVSDAVQKAASAVPDPGQRGPEKLRKVFPLGGSSGGGGGGKKFDHDVVSARLEDSRWNIDADLWRRKGQETWSAVVALRLAGESGRGDRIEIVQVTTTPAVESELVEGQLILPSISTNRIKVELQSAPVSSQLAERTQVFFEEHCEVTGGRHS
jgi:hypothetical protein